MRLDHFSYTLPSERIALRPAGDPEEARLLVVDSQVEACRHQQIRDLAEEIPPGALVVVNDTRVIPARLCGKKVATGGKVEVFLVNPVQGEEPCLAPGVPQNASFWHALGRPSRSLKAGMLLDLGPLQGKVIREVDAEGVLTVALWAREGGSFREALERAGKIPLPPYLQREADADDIHRYQTMFARVEGAVAAPTAGLHLTSRLVEALKGRGCTVAGITLHVGLGTFQSVTVDDLDNHPMHAERFWVPAETAQAVQAARARQAPVVAIGTTVVRALESAADPAQLGQVLPTSGETKLLIQPGYRFRVVDRLLTNFHWPRSTLLALVCAFGGYERVLAAYRCALEGPYRFCSYGDAMLLVRAEGP